MSERFWLTEAQMERLKPFLPRSRGKPRVDDRRVLSGIIHIQRNGLMWKDAPVEYGPVPGHGYETAHCAGYAADLNSVAASDARAFCSALI
jgi:transposase